MVAHALTGKRPPRKKEDLPKPTERMKAREGSLELDKNVGKTVIVNATAGGRGPGQPGYFCDVCSRNHKDSQSYLDHLNSRGRMCRNSVLYRASLIYVF